MSLTDCFMSAFIGLCGALSHPPGSVVGCVLVNMCREGRREDTSQLLAGTLGCKVSPQVRDISYWKCGRTVWRVTHSVISLHEASERLETLQGSRDGQHRETGTATRCVEWVLPAESLGKNLRWCIMQSQVLKKGRRIDCWETRTQAKKPDATHTHKYRTTSSIILFWCDCDLCVCWNSPPR